MRRFFLHERHGPFCNRRQAPRPYRARWRPASSDQTARTWFSRHPALSSQKYRKLPSAQGARRLHGVPPQNIAVRRPGAGQSSSHREHRPCDRGACHHSVSGRVANRPPSGRHPECDPTCQWATATSRQGPGGTRGWRGSGCFGPTLERHQAVRSGKRNAPLSVTNPDRSLGALPRPKEPSAPAGQLGSGQ